MTIKIIQQCKNQPLEFNIICENCSAVLNCTTDDITARTVSSYETYTYNEVCCPNCNYLNGICLGDFLPKPKKFQGTEKNKFKIT